ncbi:isoprenyl transferase [Desulfogranum japonicum]|uniref:isoprenyl transferase n=1 Tax=Desulfogranum japonicum TaxID=231447 RepID=UPI00048D13F6|nr:isoprenyl transferase [Desulfogranum japonicum]
MMSRSEKVQHNAQLSSDMTIPQHIAIIMDGNGRWAEARHRPRLFGHKAGVDSVRDIVETAREIGVRYLTLYAFSTENWKRPDGEVSGLMSLLKTYLRAELNTMRTNNIRLQCLGQKKRLPADVGAILEQTIEETQNCTGMTLNLALSYGGRAELIRGIRELAKKCMNGEISPDEIDEQSLDDALYTAGQPDPDLLIRTGGECRLSNFLLWQASYAELYFTEVKWPDFRKKQLIEAIVHFNERQRRYGKTGAQLQVE